MDVPGHISILIFRRTEIFYICNKLNYNPWYNSNCSLIWFQNCHHVVYQSALQKLSDVQRCGRLPMNQKIIREHIKKNDNRNGICESQFCVSDGQRCERSTMNYPCTSFYFILHDSNSNLCLRFRSFCLVDSMSRNYPRTSLQLFMGSVWQSRFHLRISMLCFRRTMLWQVDTETRYHLWTYFQLFLIFVCQTRFHVQIMMLCFRWVTLRGLTLNREIISGHTCSCSLSSFHNRNFIDDSQCCVLDGQRCGTLPMNEEIDNLNLKSFAHPLRLHYFNIKSMFQADNALLGCLYVKKYPWA